MNISKKNIVIVVVVLVMLGIGFMIYKNNKDVNYSVIYMTTWEVYVGKLSTFPDFELRDGFIFQVTKDVKDSTKTNFQLQPIKDALWAPQSMHLIKDNVVFYGELMSDSKIAETLAKQAR